MIPNAYPLPTELPPQHTLDALLRRLVRFEELCTSHRVDVRNTRVARYRRWLERPEPWGDELDRGVFIDPPGHPIQHNLDRLLYVLREVHELTWIGEGLREAETTGLASKLRLVVRGADFAALDRNTESRNTQFELRIASYLGRSGYQLDFGSLTDIIATRDRTSYFIECKRIASPAQLAKRIKEGLDQIEGRMPKSTLSKSSYGVVAVDVTKVAFSHNGLVMGVTLDHCRDIIQAKLKAISSEVLGHRPGLNGRGVIGTWLQIHIPALSQQPPLPTTRFSSIFVAGRNPSMRTRKAEKRFLAATLASDRTEPDETRSPALVPRRGLQIPEGAVCSFDEELLQELVRSGALPSRNDEHIVFSIRPPDAADDSFEDYTFFELRWVFEALPDAERAWFASSRDNAVRLLLGPLIMRRHPYVGDPPWLDLPPAA